MRKREQKMDGFLRWIVTEGMRDRSHLTVEFFRRGPICPHIWGCRAGNRADLYTEAFVH